MRQRTEITSGIRILALLLLTAALFLVVFHLTIDPINALLRHFVRVGAAEPGSSQHYSMRGGVVVHGGNIAVPSDPFAVTGRTTETLLLASVLALVVSFGLLILYRRRVVKSMRSRAGASLLEQPSSLNETSRANSQVLEFVLVDHLPTTNLPANARRLFRQLRLLPWMAAAVYAFAGLGFALAITIAVLISGHARISAMRLVILVWLYAWPAALAVNLVAATARRPRIAVISIYFTAYVTLGAIALTISPQLTWGQILLLWVINNLEPTVLLIIFMNRSVRAVGPLILLIMTLAVFGATIAPSLLLSHHIDTLAVFMASHLGARTTIIAAEGLGFTFLGLAGWFALQYLRDRYEKKKLSDQAIVLAGIWVPFAAFWFVDLAFEGYGWILSVIPAFVIYFIIVQAGFALPWFRANPGSLGHRLLVLRVFALGKQSEKLFDALGKCWRHVGTIAQIAGPDLATATVQPHEFLDFMAGRLARRFIDTTKTLDLRLSESDNIPDADGRFRVNDFFCYDDTWKLVLDRLVRDSDAVLMDLRGFSPKNAGCVFEIDELINLVPMERVVFVIDGTTDEAFLRTTIEQSWKAIRATSPNQRCSQLRLLRFGGVDGGGLADLLRALCTAAAAAPAA